MNSTISSSSSFASFLFAPARIADGSRSSSVVAWQKSMWRVGIRSVLSESDFHRLRSGAVRCFAAAAAAAAAGRGRRGRKMNSDSAPFPVKEKEKEMEKEEDEFYVVRKGDVIGLFRSFDDCLAQAGSSISDPAVSVYKGYSLQKETEEYLAARGLKNALYSINAADCKEDLFGALIPCPIQKPETHATPSKKVLQKVPSLKRSKKEDETKALDLSGSPSNLLDKKPVKQARTSAVQATPLNNKLCILEFDGASKGNPGKAGAGVIVRREDGIIVSRLREGLGVVTNNVAEYRALILGLKYAVREGFQKVLVQGDSQLVVMQVQDLWKTKKHGLIELYQEAKQLKDKLLSCKISHVKREFNSDADTEANLAITLPIGEVYEECADMC